MKRGGEVRRKKKPHDTTPWSLLAVASNSNNWTVVDRQSRHVQLNAQQKCTCIHLWTKQNIPLGNTSGARHRVIQKRALTVNKRSQAWGTEVTTWRMFKPHFFLASRVWMQNQHFCITPSAPALRNETSYNVSVFELKQNYISLTDLWGIYIWMTSAHCWADKDYRYSQCIKPMQHNMMEKNVNKLSAAGH